MNSREITGLLWLFFAAYWFVRAFSAKKTVYAESFGARLLQMTLWTIGFFLMYNARLVGTPLATPLTPQNEITTTIGTILVMVGLLFAVWARRHLGAYWSGTVTLKEGHKLIRSGPYGLSRHPIYTGIVFAFAGTVIATGEVRSLVAAAAILIAIAIKIRDEERLLQKHFPEEYLLYSREVKMIIPKIW